MADSYLTLIDFAKSYGLSVEEAKKILDTPKYSPYTKEVNGKTLVSFDVFKLEEQEDNQIEQAPEERTEDKEEQQDNTPSKREEQLQREIEELKQTIAEKDRQINDYALKFAELAQQAQLIAGQAQVLHLAEKAGAGAKLEEAPTPPPQTRAESRETPKSPPIVKESEKKDSSYRKTSRHTGSRNSFIQRIFKRR